MKPEPGDQMLSLVTEDLPAREWHEENGVIYFTVTSGGADGKGWVESLRKKGFRIGGENVFLGSDFKPTNGVVYHVAVFKGDLFDEDTRITKNIREEAEGRRFSDLHSEAAGLIREKFSDEDLEAMGLSGIIVMHKPVKDLSGIPIILAVIREAGGRLLDACLGGPDVRWRKAYGFAFQKMTLQGA